MRKRMVWTADHDMTAAAMRWNGATNEEIAARFGISAKAVANRFDRIGRPRSAQVVERRKVAPVKESTVQTEAMIRTEREQQAAATQAHAEAVMAQGGFCAFSERALGPGKWAVCLPLIWPRAA
jgi:transposase